MDQQTAQGNWRQLRGKIRERWGDITDDELEHFEGNLDQLVGMIQEKTGESRESIEGFLADAANELHDEEFAGEQTSEGYVSSYVADAREQMHLTAEKAAASLREQMDEASQQVQRKPLESVAFSFAAGLVIGIGATLILRSK